MSLLIFYNVVLGSLLLLSKESFASPIADPPQLNQQHFRVTAVPEGFYLSAKEEETSTTNKSLLVFGGYLAGMFQVISKNANFTYELVTPSGYGSYCLPQLVHNHTQEQQQPPAYSEHFRYQFECGTNDVNDRPRTNYSTDMYLGTYHISPNRQRRNYFTLPFQPPDRSTLVMVGTARNIRNIEHLVQLQSRGEQPPACMVASGAGMAFLQDCYPDIQLKAFFGSPLHDVYPAMLDGTTCPGVFIAPSFAAKTFIYYMAQLGNCFIRGQPLGIIGEPMEFGYSHFGIGVGKHLNAQVVNTLSYWINVLMVDGTLAKLYQGGAGNECGYDDTHNNNNNKTRLSRMEAIVAGIVALGAIGLVLAACLIWHRYTLKRQQHRYKMRFVQQIARNIQIGPRPGSIPPEKLCEQILHIGQGKGVIKRHDLARWLMDIKMDFLSEKDFDALWNAMDMDDSGEVDPVEFIVFLSACGPQFEKVYHQQEGLPKMERLRLAARRLSNIAAYGEDGVHKLQRQLDRNSPRGILVRRRSGISATTVLQEFSSEDFMKPANLTESPGRRTRNTTTSFGSHAAASPNDESSASCRGRHEATTAEEAKMPITNVSDMADRYPPSSSGELSMPSFFDDRSVVDDPRLHVANAANAADEEEIRCLVDVVDSVTTSPQTNDDGANADTIGEIRCMVDVDSDLNSASSFKSERVAVSEESNDP